jgi:hypothetical protein
MKANGTIAEEYFAVARPSGRATPRDTELYGQFRSTEDAEEERNARGGVIVHVTETTTWARRVLNKNFPNDHE